MQVIYSLEMFETQFAVHKGLFSAVHTHLLHPSRNVDPMGHCIGGFLGTSRILPGHTRLHPKWPVGEQLQETHPPENTSDGSHVWTLVTVNIIMLINILRLKMSCEIVHLQKKRL